MFSDIGKGTVDEARVVVNDWIARLDPLLTKLFLMARSLLHGVIDRFEINVTFKINPDPGPNPDPDRS